MSVFIVAVPSGANGSLERSIGSTLSVHDSDKTSASLLMTFLSNQFSSRNNPFSDQRSGMLRRKEWRDESHWNFYISCYAIYLCFWRFYFDGETLQKRTRGSIRNGSQWTPPPFLQKTMPNTNMSRCRQWRLKYIAKNENIPTCKPVLW